MTAAVKQALDKIRPQIEDVSRNLSSADYGYLLEELADDIEAKLQALEDAEES